MSDLSSMSRESKKRQLRRQMLDPSDSGKPGKKLKRPRESRSEEEEIVLEAGRKVRRRKRRIILTLLAVLVIAGGGFYLYNARRHFTEYSVDWEADMAASEAGFVRYVNFEENVLKYTKDGASYIDAKGKTVWSKSFELKSPVCYVNGGSAVIADQQGTNLYIFDKEGCQGEAESLLPIQRVAVSAHGVVAAMVEDARASYVTFYKKDGSTLDWSIKSILGGDGYQMDVSVSPDAPRSWSPTRI